MGKRCQYDIRKFHWSLCICSRCFWSGTVATSTEDGLMSAADKAKLDSIQADATNTDGFVQFDGESEIPVGSRKANTLYARILHDYSA